MGRRAALVGLRIAARRPASWLALVTAAAAAAWIGADPEPWWPAAALVAGAVVTAAAVGAPPREASGAAAWARLRPAWPAAGVVAAWLARAADPAAAGVAVTMVAAGAGTAAAIAWATRGGAAPAAATGQALAGAVAAAAGTGVLTVAAPPWAAWCWPLAALAGWGATAVAARVARARAAPREAPGDGLLRAVMATALAAMVACLFLAPHLARVYAGLAGAWLIVAAIPRAALGPGPDASRGGPPGAGAARVAGRVVMTYAAVLAWPPLVAAILAGSSAAAVEPLSIAAAIGVGAAVAAATAAATLAAGRSRDTTLAVALCATLVAYAIGAEAAARVSPAVPARGLMLSIPGDPARLPEPREEPRLRPSPRGVASCPAPPSPVTVRPSASRRRLSSSFSRPVPRPGPRASWPARRSSRTPRAPG